MPTHRDTCPISTMSLSGTNHRPRRRLRSPKPRIVIATVLGTNVGIALQQLVFHELPVGPGVTLMATAPVMALLIAPLEGEAIQPLGMLAALLALAGVAVTTL